MNLLTYIKKIPREVKYILLLFVATRSILTIIGVSSRKLLEGVYNYRPDWIYSKHLWLDIWGLWDSEWYLRIAANWYPQVLNAGESNYGFFPLYPLLIRILEKVIGNNYISGIIISNLCLIVACIFLYKLVKLYLDNDTALRSVKYLFLFPSAFILSGVFSESLFLALLIACFYYAKKGKWLLAGITGFFLSLTKPIGAFVILPILYEYFRSKDFKLNNIKRDIFSLALMPLGLFVFAGYCYYLVGNPLAYVYAKKTGWGVYLSHPFRVLYLSLCSHSIELVFNAIFAIVAIVILSLFCKKIGFSYIGFSYWLLGILLIFIPLMYGVQVMTRYALVIFPFYILFARLSKNHYIDQALTLFLALCQGFLMVFWSAGFHL